MHPFKIPKNEAKRERDREIETDGETGTKAHIFHTPAACLIYAPHIASETDSRVNLEHRIGVIHENQRVWSNSYLSTLLSKM